MPIYNCHIHIFTIDHVPENFLPFKIPLLMKVKFLRGLVTKILRNILPLTDRDLLDRYANFIDISYEQSQETVFNKIHGYYPKDTKFIVLPMDMEFMSAGKVKISLEQQHADLATLRKKYSENIVPFVAVDPRRENILPMVKKLVEEENFKGIKIYPPLGYYPTDERLYPVYEYAEKNKLPIMSHCSRGGVWDKRKITDVMLTHPISRAKLEKKKPKEFTDYYTDPDNYVEVMNKFPELKICLAHLGGSEEWESYLNDPWQHNLKNQKKSWLSKITDMIKSEKYPNLYTDISYSILEKTEHFALVKVLLQDKNLREKILFGSDFYMVESEKIRERKISMLLRAYLGDNLFFQIAENNIVNYLN